MKKTVLWVAAILMALSASLLVCANQSLKENELSDVSKSNIEALTQSEGSYYLVHEKKDGRCEISVGTNGKLQLLGGTVLKANAEGIVSFDGQVTCIGIGDVYCRPVECIDLYRTILSK